MYEYIHLFCTEYCKLLKLKYKTAATARHSVQYSANKSAATCVRQSVTETRGDSDDVTSDCKHFSLRAARSY
jgi:hypothetical protein